MQIEAIGEAITYKWPGGEIRLQPGRPVELPEARIQKILAKAPGKVRIRPNHAEWLAAWRELAALTHGVTREDARFQLVFAGLDCADGYFLAGDWVGFQRAVRELKGVMTR